MFIRFIVSIDVGVCMIKIISISNAHQWDNVEINSKDFIKLCEVLALSRFEHFIEYVKEGKTFKGAIS